MTWQEKAKQLMEVIKQYYCMQVFFEKDGISQELSEYIIKQKYLT